MSEISTTASKNGHIEIDKAQAKAYFATLLHGAQDEGTEYVIAAIRDGRVNQRRVKCSDTFVPDETLCEAYNVYATFNRFDASTNGRLEKDVTIVSGIGMDLDIKAGPTFKKSGEFKQDWPHDADELKTVMDAVSAKLRPTMLVDSGSGGLHPYWLFNRPMPRTETLAQLADMFRLFVNHIATEALGRPIVFDSVMNLDRVLKVPGTIRHPKVSKEQPEGDHPASRVELLYNDGPRYSPAGLRQMAETVPAPAPEEVAPTTSTAKPKTARTKTPGDVPVTSTPPADHPRVAAWLRTVIANQVEELAAIRVTGMNNGLNEAAITLGGLAPYGYTDKDEIYELLIGACDENGLLDGNGGNGHNSRTQVDATFESGWGAGLEKPYDLPKWMTEDLKTTVQVNNPAMAAEWLRAELGVNELSGIFIKDGVLVHTPRVGEDGYVEPSQKEKECRIDHGPAQVQTVEAEKVKAMVAVRYDVGKEAIDKDTQAKVWVPAFFPREAAQDAVNAALLGIGCPNVQILRGVTHTPLVRRTGTLLEAKGYDSDSGLLYLPDRDLEVPDVPEAPTLPEVRRAVELILKPVAEFPFVSDNHLSNWLGMMFTPVMRELLTPPYQMGVITAPNAGSGKTKLVKLIGIVHGMVMRGEMPREKAEMKKALMSVLITTTAPVVLFDNVRGEIYSSELEALITSETMSDRLLGVMREVTATNDRLWVVSGNNAKIGGDMARRILEVKIDPKLSDPTSRTFAIADLDGWMEEHRGEYVAAMLTIVRAWIHAGQPVAASRGDDNFAKWRGALRGMLEWAGFPGKFGEVEEGGLGTVSEETKEWGIFMEALKESFGVGTPFYAEDVAKRLTNIGAGTSFGQIDNPIHSSVLPGDLAEKFERNQPITRSLGKWLSNRDGTFAFGICVRKTQVGKKAASYTIEKET